MSTFSLTLHQPVQNGSSPIKDMTVALVKSWTRSTRAVGGYWLGTSRLISKDDDRRAGVTTDDMLELFLEGMNREIRETVGGFSTWEGYIAEMELTLDGVAYSRSMITPPLANACKSIYTRTYPNLLLNGGAELGAWTSFNGATVTQATNWVNSGSYSCRIVVADAIVRGAIVGTVNVVAGIAYTCTGAIRVESGTWHVVVKRGDNDDTLAKGVEHDVPGDVAISLNIESSNTYTGTAYVYLKTKGVAGAVWGDSFVFQQAPVPDTQTGWYSDQGSAAIYGRVEQASLLVGMTDEAANSRTVTDLRRQAFPKTRRPGDLTSFDYEVSRNKNGLSLTVHGFVHTLANLYCKTTSSPLGSSALVAALLAESEFIRRGTLTTNTNPYIIDNRAPIRQWQAIQDIIAAGDGSETGARWIGGVYNDRYFDYEAAPEVIAYHFRRGQYYQASGGPLEPWFALPGFLLYLDDAPIGPKPSSGHLEDDPRVEFVAEVELGPADPDHPNGTLTMRPEAQ